jgi:hypothetical protein
VLHAQESLRRLAALTVQNFPGRSFDTAEAFWKALGHETPIKDGWGGDFLVSAKGVGLQKRVFWRSAGPDRRWGTGDDLEFEVPYSDGPGGLELNFAPAGGGMEGQQSTDVK